MRLYCLLCLALLLLMATAVFGQARRMGDRAVYDQPTMAETWKGVVSAVNDETREITLTQTKKDKVKTFTGVLKKGLMARRPDGQDFELKPSDVPIGATVTVTYRSRNRKDEQGKKASYNEISNIAIDEMPKS